MKLKEIRALAERFAPKRLFHKRIKTRKSKVLKGSLFYIDSDLNDQNRPKKAFGVRKRDWVDNSEWYVKLGYRENCPLCKKNNTVQ
jgi:hypothetical protein